ncbi:MAG: S9 family peptidase [Sediminibacterium sp. Gen4]|jgi:dipeptidyl aminopeptidase/acylaminoacyl peptidase|uniref:S9 family peptidase n=1 Tax=unclassified Sediminibacterium TaxID=2635961 RepID=UPI0015C00005|nr:MULTISPECIES: prolyl oligopeptidase family serine peptidase [unclassified Sediminibacterium]MBW0162630.1 prolyl oligopeptidase family serine peptidase [Sediminibacterium sp.]MBW0163265.1 prolyl oligopeptidase family serine peptidase [Sediminibacterium sp.]NWK66162.1 S9 family peptidase [Sediminibacterium sp. Gen4]
MKHTLLFTGLMLVCLSSFAQLTVEKIMRDPKWIGTSPSNVFWSADSKKIYFSWNPDKKISDSTYVYTIGANGAPVPASLQEVQLAQAQNNAVFNEARTKMLYALRGDLYMVDITSGKTTRITQTQEQEFAPRFILNDEWVVYNRNQNLFAWHTQNGSTLQLTNISRGTETAVTAMPLSGRGAAQLGGARNVAPAIAALVQSQEQWLRDQQLDLFTVLKERKEKRDARTEFLRANRDTDTLKLIGIGEKQLQNLQISPDGRFVTYRLYQAPTNSKSTIVPDYVTESGFTTDIPARTKVGAPLGRYEFYVFDKTKDKLMMLVVDSAAIPGIMDQPDYVKDYPKQFGNRRAPIRGVIINGPYWNASGTAAIVDIRSQDNKDRWIMQLDAENAKLKLIDRQRDEAWIGGPGISAFGATLGWINNAQFYFQSEATGYSHLYVYDMASGRKTALTEGKYEVQSVSLSNNKQHFYLLTNEEHPGKLNWYRINKDGSGKEKITNMTGGYEVSMSPDEKWIAYRYSYSNKPWELFVQENAAGKTAAQITNKAVTDEFKAYPWRDPKMITIPARDGQQIYARLYEPTKAKNNKAAVIFVHGAGYLQNVHYWWSSYFREYMFHNLLADQGYTVIDIDYRASSGYGRDWRTGIYRHMGGKDLDDHVDAAKFLTKNYGVDAGKIGIYGGSYGGFITLMGLFTTPDVFKAGAALRPVTDWAHYNHGYTSNILNEPVNDSIAYAKSSPINFANGLKNHLLICHGMVDVNVHFQDVVRLSQKLIELGKDNWELAVYPMEDHGFVEPSSWTDEYKRILKLFNERLLRK